MKRLWPDSRGCASAATTRPRYSSTASRRRIRVSMIAVVGLSDEQVDQLLIRANALV
jgi:hypothetical protein